MSFRLATISRSDERRVDRTFAILLLPLASLWYLLVLRQIRYYGIATCARQHWVTREKVEVTIENPSTELVRPKVSAR
jgi:hyaluronan synthase